MLRKAYTEPSEITKASQQVGSIQLSSSLLCLYFETSVCHVSFKSLINSDANWLLTNENKFLFTDKILFYSKVCYINM